MRTRRPLLISFLSVALVAAAAAVLVPDSPGVAADHAIVDPQPFVWTQVSSPEPHYVGVLEYGRAEFTLNNGETLTTRAYRQEGGEFSIPGPTMHMVPGNKYVLRFRNLLDYEPPSAVHNDFKDPNATNLHTHGLHISGESPSDDVTRMFEGGFGGDYVYDIPADHMGGTYWYHAHHHGSTFLQVSTGGFGMIVIDDGGDGVPEPVKSMAERQLVVAHLDPSAAGTGGDTLVSGSLAPGWTVNGLIGGTIAARDGTWEHWRIVLADSDARTKDVTIGANCATMLLARDGVWRTVAPKELLTNTVNLTGASRADLAVKCTGASELKVGTEVVATIAVNGTPDPGPHPFADDEIKRSSWSAVRPTYLRDLRGETVVNSERISMGARTVNGRKFDVNTPTFSLPTDAVQDWSIKGAVNHPFHLHVYHFQAQAGCGGDFEEGEYYDTIAGNCSVRFDLRPQSKPYEGRTIMHCHILGHEDQGAMTWMDVIGGTPPPEFPANHGYAAYYALAPAPPAAPSGLSAMATSSSTIDLAWSDNSSDESGFAIQRSTDGSTWSPLATVAADVATYTDTGLASNTTYWYRVNAHNDAGASAWSLPASATTSDGTAATAVRPDSVTVATSNLGKGLKQGAATITVVDNLGQPVAGATVTGDFSGTFDEPGRTGLTDPQGVAVITTNGSAKGGITVTFCATGITAPGLEPWTGSVCATG